MPKNQSITSFTPEQAETLETVIRDRRTVHEYQSDKKPDNAQLKQWLASAAFAPNHHLTEPWHFYLIGEQTKAEIINLNSKLLLASKGKEKAEHKARRWAGIPGWLVVTSQVTESALQTKENYAAAACAIQNLLLLMSVNGVHSKWSTGPVIRDSEFYDICWIDAEHEQIVGLIWYGYAVEIGQVGRKPIQEKLTELA
jgi:nitroreductase